MGNDIGYLSVQNAASRFCLLDCTTSALMTLEEALDTTEARRPLLGAQEEEWGAWGKLVWVSFFSG